MTRPHLLALVLLLGSCSSSKPEPKVSKPPKPIAKRQHSPTNKLQTTQVTPPPKPALLNPAPQGKCVVTMCLTGAVDQDSPTNATFGRLCHEAAVLGVLPDCDTKPCRRTHDSFMLPPQTALYPKLFAALDQDQDGRVGPPGDAECEVNLVGFSWGGVNAVVVAKLLEEDERVSKTHKKVARLLLFDPYQPMGHLHMKVTPNVDKTLVWRHSSSPSNDCSSGAPLGPYEGLAPECTATQDCRDFDYAKAPKCSFATHTGAKILGQQVGHCRVPEVAYNAALLELRGKSPNTLSPPDQRQVDPKWRCPTKSEKKRVHDSE